MQELAARVAGRMPGWRVRGVTLAAPGRLEAAVVELGGPVVYPFFMAGGWFTKVELPRRLAAAGSDGLSVRAPFGESAAVTKLAVDAAVSEAARQGWRSDEVSLVLAAHGSGRSRVPAEAAVRVAAAVRAAGRFAEVLPEARGQAARVRAEAEGDKAEAVARATGAAKRFELIAEQYRAAPEVTRKRLLLETMQSVLAGSPKVMVEGGGDKVIYLPIENLGAQAPSPAASEPRVDRAPAVQAIPSVESVRTRADDRARRIEEREQR